MQSQLASIYTMKIACTHNGNIEALDFNFLIFMLTEKHSYSSGLICIGMKKFLPIAIPKLHHKLEWFYMAELCPGQVPNEYSTSLVNNVSVSPVSCRMISLLNEFIIPNQVGG